MCKGPSCDDGIVSGVESDVDCGPGCEPCQLGQSCLSNNDCETAGCIDETCRYAYSCAELHSIGQGLGDGRYWIDPDGPQGSSAFEVHCEMDLAGGGWTLVLISSDDGQDTWTWDNRAWLGADVTIVGTLDEIDHDFKSRAYNELPFADLLFTHAPSTIWAQYDDVGDGGDLGNFVAAIDVPDCNPDLGGNGFKMTDGTLMSSEFEQNPMLCDTDLYFNVGDHEWEYFDGCPDLGSSYNNAAYGPVWNAGRNHGCDFDDPGYATLGPMNPCGECGDAAAIEYTVMGFGEPLAINTGAAGAAGNFMRVYVR
ncbi:hypothetical protein DB30_01741 [Enhygromyxa salina]|uniref:Fibrinogen C-terminal domain-containing protein n=1 Tax=Enhygromyxa salina TaxID=215803 RepID=A0A0C2CRJ6_9BACT|nr:hypothetical protein DB30_01741 [Enhygromyxa salina]